MPEKKLYFKSNITLKMKLQHIKYNILQKKELIFFTEMNEKSITCNDRY